MNGLLLPLKLAWLNLMRNRRRSLLTVLLITIVVSAITSAGGFGLSTYHSLRESAARDVGHLTLTVPGYFSDDESYPLQHGLENTDNLIHALQQHDDILAVQPRIHFSGLISNGEKSNIYIGIGVNYREFSVKGSFSSLIDGKTLSSHPEPDIPEVMLAKDLASSLRVKTGDWITLLSSTSQGALNAIDFKVKGIYATGIPDLDKRQLYIDITQAQQLLDSHRVSTLSIFLPDTAMTGEIATAVEGVIAENEKSATGDKNRPDVLVVTPWWERAFFYKKVRGLYDTIFGVMGSVLAVLIFVALFSSMTTSVSERTREIGTLSALGAYPSEIIKDFVREAGMLAGAGWLAGTILTGLISGMTFIVEFQMPPAPGSNQGYPLYVYFSPLIAIVTGFVVFIICCVAAFLAARKGAKKPITEALIHV